MCALLSFEFRDLRPALVERSLDLVAELGITLADGFADDLEQMLALGGDQLGDEPERVCALALETIGQPTFRLLGSLLLLKLFAAAVAFARLLPPTLETVRVRQSDAVTDQAIIRAWTAIPLSRPGFGFGLLAGGLVGRSGVELLEELVRSAAGTPVSARRNTETSGVTNLRPGSRPRRRWRAWPTTPA